MERKIQPLLDELNADGYQKGKDWRDYHVFLPKYEGKPKIGLPYVILEKDGEMRISTPKESMDYLDFCNK